jgi:hypothetical protein
MRRLKILTWHVHGSYLYYLTQAPHDFYLLSKSDRSEGYLGRYGHFPWGDNVFDMPVGQVRAEHFDLVLFQHRNHYLHDQPLLSVEQQRGPRIYLEHDTPWGDPTDEPHYVNDPGVLLVHVTPYNQLMWNNGRTPTRVIEHGVIEPRDVRYSGEVEKGVVVINHLTRRGRRLGADVFAHVRDHIPLDLVGMAAQEAGGLDEVRHDALPSFEAHYRFLFNPIRYTSLGLAVIEAMLIGMPVIGLATTEMATAVPNGVAGYVDTSVDRLIERMRELLKDPAEARRLGQGAQRYARERFGIRRFVADWNSAFTEVAGRPSVMEAVC